MEFYISLPMPFHFYVELDYWDCFKWNLITRPQNYNITHVTKYLLDLWIYKGLIRSNPFPQVYISVGRQVGSVSKQIAFKLYVYINEKEWANVVSVYELWKLRE